MTPTFPKCQHPRTWANTVIIGQYAYERCRSNYIYKSENSVRSVCAEEIRMYVLDDKRKEYNRQYWLKRKQELSKPTECRLCKKTVPMMPGKKYCSSACANRANGPAKAHGLSKERFYEKVQKTEGCWLWLGSITRGGYGSYTLKSYKGTTRAHRIAYLLEYGPFDPKLFVCHRCDNPPCVRPEHLFLGTRQDNTDDMMRKGRHWRQRMNLRWAGAT